jgi:AraC-like DNA-binding protein
VLSGLPRVVRVHLRNDSAGEWLERSIHHGLERVQAAAPGSDVILARLAEVLFTEALQRYVTQLPPGRTGWLAGAGDATVGRGLAALHRKPAHPWTLDELARKVGASRSVLTERFTLMVGRPPIQYLAAWRIQLAARRLLDGGTKVSAIAQEVGYESEAAFSRAFKRLTGTAPAAWRSRTSTQTGSRST